jgi:hypothetical protein
MKKAWMGTMMLAAVIVGVAVPSAFAAEKEDEKEVKIKFAECPAAVQKTLQREAGGAKIEEVEKESEDGKTNYEAEVKIGGKNYSIEVAEDGTLLEKELDEEETEVEIKLADCPAAVQKSLQSEVGGVKIGKVDKETAHGHTVYEIDVAIDGKNYEIIVNEDGLLLTKKLDQDEEKEDGKDDDDDDDDDDDEKEDKN